MIGRAVLVWREEDTGSLIPSVLTCATVGSVLFIKIRIGVVCAGFVIQILCFILKKNKRKL